MAFIDGAGVAYVGGTLARAAAVVGDQVTTPYAPKNGAHEPTLTVWLTALLATSGPLNSDVQWQASTVANFSTIAWSQTSVNRPDGLISIASGPYTDGATIYWRTRSAETGTSGWGQWSVVWSFVPDLNVGRAIEYVYLNQGIDPILSRDTTSGAYVDQNVGYEPTPDAKAQDYVDLNVGAEITQKREGIEYANYGDVNTLTPQPHIWFLRPSIGRAGDSIEVVGFGFGDLQATHNGRLEFKPDPSDPQWANVAINTWHTFPPTDKAYGPDRELNAEMNIIDAQHQTISFTIPPTADPPGHPVRVTTDGS